MLQPRDVCFYAIALKQGGSNDFYLLVKKERRDRVLEVMKAQFPELRWRFVAEYFATDSLLYVTHASKLYPVKELLKALGSAVQAAEMTVAVE